MLMSINTWNNHGTTRIQREVEEPVGWFLFLLFPDYDFQRTIEDGRNGRKGTICSGGTTKRRKKKFFFVGFLFYFYLLTLKTTTVCGKEGTTNCQLVAVAVKIDSEVGV